MRFKERGVALLLVMATILILSIIAGAVLVLVNSRYHVTAHLRQRTKAFYLAEAGIQHALWRIRNNENSGGVAKLCDLEKDESDTESIKSNDLKDTSWGGDGTNAFAQAIDIEYTKTEENPADSKSESSKDDKFTIKVTVTY